MLSLFRIFRLFRTAGEADLNLQHAASYYEIKELEEKNLCTLIRIFRLFRKRANHMVGHNIKPFISFDSY
jgi:hypothetical protein